MNKIWSEADKQYIRDNAGVLTDAQLAATLSTMLGRTITLQAVRKQRQKMGIAKLCGRGICKLAKHAVVGAVVNRPTEN